MHKVAIVAGKTFVKLTQLVIFNTQQKSVMLSDQLQEFGNGVIMPLPLVVGYGEMFKVVRQMARQFASSYQKVAGVVGYLSHDQVLIKHAKYELAERPTMRSV
jgi:hypothetical protein